MNLVIGGMAVARLTTASWPANAPVSAGASKRDTSTGVAPCSRRAAALAGVRARADTSWSAVANAGTAWLPIAPVPPVTNTRIAVTLPTGVGTARAERDDGADAALAEIRPVPVPHDCTDGFGAAYWRRLAAYLDPTVRAGISMLARTGEEARLADDLCTGRWQDDHADLLGLDSLDVGYCLVIAEP